MEDKETTVQIAYLFYTVISLLYIIAFWVGACNNQQAATEDELAIDSDDDGIDTSSDEDEDGNANVED